MPTSPVPFLHPSEIVFSARECPKTEKFCVYNPFPYDIVFKIDNPDPSTFSLSLRQGLISSSNKVYIDLTCTSTGSSRDGVLQVRFFKCLKSRQGHRPRFQQYVGFREVKLVILTNGSKRERSPTAPSSTSSLSHHSPGSSSSYNSGSPTNERTDRQSSGRKFQIISNLALVFVLFIFGLTISCIEEDWFASNIGGTTPHTCAVISFTLAFVLFLRVLTIR